MKRFISVLLTLIMLVSIIPLSSISASAASNNNGWVEVKTYELDGNRKITVFREDTYGLLGCTSRLKFTATSIERRSSKNFWGKITYYTQATTLSYTTPKYTKCFSRTPYTIKEIIARDSKLNTTGIYMNMENIFLCEWLKVDYAGCAKYLGLTALGNIMSDVQSDLKNGAFGSALGCANDAIDLYCTYMDFRDAKTFPNAICISTLGLVKLISLGGNSTKLDTIIGDNKELMYNTICNVSNSTSISTY